MSDKMTVQQARDAVSYCHPRMPEMLANFETAVRANEKAEVNARWQLVWDAEVRKMEVYEARIRADERAKADAVITATQKWIDAMDKWLETGVPSSPEASKAIYEQAIAAISKAKATKC